MNRIIKIYLSAVITLFISYSGYSQDTKEIVSDTLDVSGVCGMCEERIENAALIKGVKKVEWTPESQKLIVVYRADKVSLEEIAQSIASAGHDNGLVLSTDDEYDNVHSCCKYRDLDPH